MTKLLDDIKKTAVSPILGRETENAEKLINYLVLGSEKVKLSKTEIEKLERYFFVYDQLNQKKSRHETANRLEAKFKISKSQAYRDIFNAQYVVASSISIDTKFYESFLLDAIVETIRLAANKNDLRAKAQAERNLAMVLGYPKDDSNKIKPEMLSQNILIINSDPATLGLERIPNIDEQVQKLMKKWKKNKLIELQHDDEH